MIRTKHAAEGPRGWDRLLARWLKARTSEVRDWARVAVLGGLGLGLLYAWKAGLLG